MSSFRQFIREKVVGWGIFGITATFLGTLASLDYAYQTYWSGEPASSITWAATVTLGFYLFVGLLNYCWFAQSAMQDEIDRMSRVKARLEEQFLSNRGSSKKKR